MNCFAIPNRRLLDKKVGWDWSGEWRIVAENQNKIPTARERSKRVPSSENSQCLTWSGCRESNPVHTHPMRAYYRCTTARLCQPRRTTARETHLSPNWAAGLRACG